MSAKSLAITANRALRSQAPRTRRQLATAAQAEVQQQQPTPIASTSKPVTPLSPPVEPSRAPHIVIPAPGLTPTRGTNRLRIDVAGGVPSSAHSLAIIQALEERVGRIVHIQQTKQNEPPVLKSRIYVTLLHPVTLKDTLRLEVVAPKLQSDYRTAGPSLAEIEDATLPSNDSELVIGRKDVMLVSVNEAPAYTNALGSRLGAGSARSWRHRREVPQEVQERQKEVDDDIYQALGRWDGFYGGFQGLRRQYESHVQEAEKTQAQKRKEAEERRRAEEKQREELHQAAIKAFRARAVETKPSPSESQTTPASTSAQELLEALKGETEPPLPRTTAERTDRLAERVRKQARRERLLASRAAGSASSSSRRASATGSASAAGFKYSQSTEPRTQRRRANKEEQPEESGNPLSVVKHWFIGSNKTP